MSNSHMSSVLYEAKCMASSCSFFQWLLLGHLRVRCRTMSDMSFMSGVRCAVSKKVLQVCYHSQTFRFMVLLQVRMQRSEGKVENLFKMQQHCLLCELFYLLPMPLVPEISRRHSTALSRMWRRLPEIRSALPTLQSFSVRGMLQTR